jgi:gamma-glutamyltranspeptidase
MTAENTRSKAQRNAGQPVVQPITPCDPVESHKWEMLKALIEQQVLHALGEPRNLLKVQVRPLWDSNYRVNVFVGADAARAKIPHSYFVVADGDGNMVSATPTIHKHY